MQRSIWITAVVLLVLCCSAVTCAAAGLALYRWVNGPGGGLLSQAAAPTVTEVPPAEVPPAPETAAPWTDTPQPTPTQLREGEQVLADLEGTEVPINNLMDLTGRLKGKTGIPLTLPAPSKPYQVGDRQRFWVTNSDSNETFQLDATLQSITDHTYFWVEDQVPFKKNELAQLTATFEAKIYPTTREFFGSEWSPGVDSDPHLYILLGSKLGSGLAGYFSSLDEYNPLAHRYSNAHEMFILNADGIRLGDQFTYGVLAHEFQHMIHWYRDLNEETWMNEGFSELAALINGYDPGGFDFTYTSDPDLQLTDWGGEIGQNDRHYGASFLFITYLMDRLGEAMVRELVSSPENGLRSIDQLLETNAVRDPQTGQGITADDLFSDWTVTNALDDPGVADGRYAYRSYHNLSVVQPEEVTGDCSGIRRVGTVSQYGADYLSFRCSGNRILHFQGKPQVPVLPEGPYSGEYAFWSFRGDESDMTLTRTFDLSALSGPVTLTYRTWYDLEEDYDYLYLEASTDGRNWTILRTPSGTDRNVSGNSFGWGYNGQSGGWLEEAVDLSAYAGSQVQLRFEYITDAAVNGQGLMLDDIAVPELGYFEDFETGAGGWEAAGFVRIANRLPQRYSVSLITYGEETRVTPITLDENNQANIPVDFNGGVTQAVLVVSGTTRYTTQPASYLITGR